VDLSGVIPLGSRIKLTQTTVKYFIVTAIDASTITFYGGTDYTLANASISSPSYSLMKAPVGFPLSPTKWTVETTFTNGPAKTSPTANTWYGDTALSPTGPSISIPIGLWEAYYEVIADVDRAATGSVAQATSLSTSASSESDATMSCTVSGSNFVTFFVPIFRKRIISVTVKTLHYLIIRTTQSGLGSINIRGDVNTGIIRAVCAYL
jgi:hypothetical protein